MRARISTRSWKRRGKEEAKAVHGKRENAARKAVPKRRYTWTSTERFVCNAAAGEKEDGKGMFKEAGMVQEGVDAAATWLEEDCCVPNQDGCVVVSDDLDALFDILPPKVMQPLVAHARRDELLEVIMDLGRRPEARFLGSVGGEFLHDEPISHEDLLTASRKVGQFGGDNRAGITSTLHRISAIRNRGGVVVGLTCRVGRAVTGHIDMIRDMLDTPVLPSLLFLGRPGVGKTTVIRELARTLSDDFHKRVVIVDTSNEIGGDGDVPHPAIGGARRMQVADPAQQHRVMIEAVENHMPEVIIVDEIGTEAEALACRTIAERGVILIGTAHGQYLENLIKNPTLSDLVGGVQTVTLGDDEARFRGTQKSVMERKALATFPIVIEMRERSHWVAHLVEQSVDALLVGKRPIVQMRTRGAKGKVVKEKISYDVCTEDDEAEFFKHSEAFDFGSTSMDEEDPYSWVQRLGNIPDKDSEQSGSFMSMNDSGSSTDSDMWHNVSRRGGKRGARKVRVRVAQSKRRSR